MPAFFVPSRKPTEKTTETSSAQKRRLVKRVYNVLDERYGGAAWDATRRRPDPLDDVVRTILSQNTTDENRDRAFVALRLARPTWEAVLETDLRTLKRLIRVAGLVQTKAPAIRDFLKWLKNDRGRLDLSFLADLDTDEGIEMLVQHKGIGLKTAYIVLAFACGKDLCAVDTHVHRILSRLALIGPTCGREKAHEELRPLIPAGKARVLHMNLIDFGKDLCTARNPGCEMCPLRRSCAYFKTLS